MVSKEHSILPVHITDTDELLQMKIGASVLSDTISLLLGILIVLNIISIRIKEAKSPIHLSKYLFKLVAFENPFMFKFAGVTLSRVWRSEHSTVFKSGHSHTFISVAS